MRLRDITLTEKERLEEGKIRNALAAAGLAATLSGAASQQPPVQPSTPTIQTPQVAPIQPSVQPEWVHLTPTPVIIDALAGTVLDKYSVNPHLAKRVARAAMRYEYSDFPTAIDILAIVGIESSFDPGSISGLKHDPAVGLMQVRPGVWNLADNALSTIDKQIKVGAHILHAYYRQLGNKEAAIHAYNVGLTNYMRKTNLNPDYVSKWNLEREMYSDTL